MRLSRQPERIVTDNLRGIRGGTHGVEIKIDGSDFAALEAQVVLAPEDAAGFWIRCTWDRTDEMQEIEIPIDALPALRSMLKQVDRRIRAMRNGLTK